MQINPRIHVDPLLVDQIDHCIAQANATLAQAEQDFIAHSDDYRETMVLDELRAREFGRLQNGEHIYLDYTGGGLYAESQLRDHMALLAKGVYGNPHSLNPTSLAMTELDEQARRYIYEYFNIEPSEYAVIFTPNASGALKLVGESYPFEDRGQYLLTFDNHNSVNGIREFAKAKGAPVTYSPLMPQDLRLDEEALRENLNKAIVGGNNLFAYPAQSNFSGVQHDLGWIAEAHAKGWDVLLDAAAFAPTNRLDISRWQPDFVTISFYKMFGYPTGLGALIVRRSLMKKLHRPWFAGGTITIASVTASKHYLHDNEAAFEDGTINYLNIPAIEIGLSLLDSVGIDTIHQRVMALTDYLMTELLSLKHQNGESLVHVYGPTNTENRGGTIAFNLYDPNGMIFDYHLVEELANQINISLRTGCFCNPGAGEIAHGIAKERMEECFADDGPHSFEGLVMVLTHTGDVDSIGSVRASVGIATNFADLYRFVHFLSGFLNVESEGLMDYSK